MISPPPEMLKTALRLYAEELLERLDTEISEVQAKSAVCYRNYLEVLRENKAGLILEAVGTQKDMFQDFALSLSSLEGQRKIASDVLKIVNHYNKDGN